MFYPDADFQNILALVSPIFNLMTFPHKYNHVYFLFKPFFGHLICLEEKYLFIYNLSYRRDVIKCGTKKTQCHTYGKNLNGISVKFGDCT
jgi:hypothetical protein